VRRAAVNSGRKFAELKTSLHPPDHSATFKEAEYLKAIYLKFLT
jgi:23S rRNA (cytosine1962-C5)-methyltransferase